MNANENARTELLQALARLGQIRPEWRLGQMIANLATTAGRMGAGGVWDLEDEEALAAAESLIAEDGHGETGPLPPSAVSIPNALSQAPKPEATAQ